MILANGDSWTGGPIYYPNKHSHWPDQLSQKYGLDVTNLAWAGASNERIYRTTIEYLYSDQPVPTHIIIGWSSSDRAELPTVSGLYMRVNPIPGCDTFVENQKPVPNLTAIRELYYRYLYCEDLSVKLHTNNMLTLRDLCAYKGIKLSMFNSFSPQPKLMDHQGYSLRDWIVKPDTTMNLVLKDLNFGITESKHTTPEGQAHWADCVYSRLNIQ